MWVHNLCEAEAEPSPAGETHIIKKQNVDKRACRENTSQENRNTYNCEKKITEIFRQAVLAKRLDLW